MRRDRSTLLESSDLLECLVYMRELLDGVSEGVAQKTLPSLYFILCLKTIASEEVTAFAEA